MKKKKYAAPDTELMYVQIEQNIMSERGSNAPAMDTETWDEWDD